MKKGLLLLSAFILIIISCNSKNNEQETETITPNEPQEGLNTATVQTLELKDSLLIGYPKTSDKKFIDSLEKSHYYFPVYEDILKKMNKKYIPFANNKVIKEEKIGDIVLKLINKRIKKDEVEIELSTYKDNKKIDSIVFYKYQWDKNVPDSLQRRELLSYIDDNFYLWNLKTFTNHSEDAVGIQNWKKYKINTKTGKIQFIKEMYLNKEE